MIDTTLKHYGVLGMKWGVRRKSLQDKSTGTTSLSNEELQKRISRLRIEQEYSALISSKNSFKLSKGHEFVLDILKDSSKNISKQIEDYIKRKEDE